MSAEVLKEFLVSLGFKLDEAALKKWDSALGRATKDVVSFAAAVTTSATAVTAAVGKIADEMEKLYYSSRRTQTSVENIQALGYAASQMGGTVEGARGSLEGLARAMRNNPGIAGFLRGQFGINPNQDGTKTLDQLAERFQRMPYYLAHAYAEMLGIDEHTLMAMIQGMGEFQEEYHRLAGMSAVDAQSAAKASHGFMVALRKLGAAFSVLSQVVGTRLMPIAKFFVNVAERSIELLIQLDKYTDGWSTAIGSTLVGALTGALVAWKLLNIGFMASPLGLAITLVLGLAAALALLYDDYKSWEEGGKSLIDWAAWKYEIEQAGKWVVWIGDKLEWLLDKAKAVFDLLPKLDQGELINPTPAPEIDNAISPPGSHDFILDAARWVGRKMGIGGGTSSGKPDPTNPGGTSSGGSATDPGFGGDKKLPLGIRQNNPGNLRSWGDAPVTNGFANFKTAFDGLSAMAGNLQVYAKRGWDSVESVISHWAPSNENDTGAYIGAVSKSLGVDSKQRLNLRDPETLQKLISAITQHENGMQPYSPELVSSAVSSRLGGSMTATLGGTQVAMANPEAAGSVTLNQTNNVSVSGVAPDQVAAKVGGEIDQANNSALRDMKGAVR